MAGGLLNIVSQGNNNIILTGNPTKTFFKAVYSKYTNFGLQKFRLDYDGMRDLRLTEPSTFSFKVPRYADLLMDTYLVITLPDIWSPIYNPCASTNDFWSSYDFRWIKNLGCQMISEMTLTCGSLTIQKYSGDYLAAMVNRDFSSTKQALFDRMSGNVAELNDPANAHGRANSYPSALYATDSTGTSANPAGAEPSIRGRELYIPLNTWFTLDSKCAFPLISLQYNELVISVTLRPIQELFQVRDIFDTSNNHPYIQPDFNQSQFQMYRFLQTPPGYDINGSDKYENKITTWNADIHLISTYCFLSPDETKLFAAEDQVYLVKDVFRYNFENINGSTKVKLFSNGMVSNWMWYLQRNDVNMRNEWSNYTNWPYENLPGNIIPAPASIHYPSFNNTGPLMNPNQTNTGYFITGNFNSDNERDILETMGIVLNGDYRENLMTRGIYDYIEKYTRTAGAAKEGLYCYNFCLNTSPTEYQPSGAINLSKFKTIELELTTYIPPVDPDASQFNIICNNSGDPIGVSKQNWRLYQYNFNMVVFEERYNILSFIGGNCGMLYAR
jgi:hypothetical protein